MKQIFNITQIKEIITDTIEEYNTMLDGDIRAVGLREKLSFHVILLNYALDALNGNSNDRSITEYMSDITSSEAKSKKFLIRAGIIGNDGKLTDRYK